MKIARGCSEDIKTAAPLHEEAKGRIFYHGTGLEEAAEAILQNGIQPREITMPDTAKSKAWLAPVKDRVYLTTEFKYAAIYALGGSLFGSEPHPTFFEGKDPYGYIFEIPGSELAGDVVPDEDSIGEILYLLWKSGKDKNRLQSLESGSSERYPGERDRLQNAIAKNNHPINQPHAAKIAEELSHLAHKYLTANQIWKVSDGEYAAWANAGKKLQKRLPDHIVKWMLDNGAHAAHQGAVRSSRCWKFDKKAAQPHPVEQLMQFCTEVPIPQPEAKVAKEVFHGTPHEFESFSTDSIGKGEGNQSYGWGLYFTETKGVADWYRKSLTPANPVWSLDGQPINIDDYAFPDCQAIRMEGDPQSDYMKGYLRNLKEKYPDKYRLLMETTEKYKGRVTKQISSGYVYAADIPDDDTMLLWDTSLVEQPDKVKQALQPKPEVLAEYEELNREADRFERDTPEWNSLINRAIAIRKKYPVIAVRSYNPTDGKGLYRAFSTLFGNDQRASKALRKLGIMGIKYFDGSSRGGGKGTFNYVIFDASDVKNVRKNATLKTAAVEKWNEKFVVGRVGSYRIAVNQSEDATYITAWTEDNKKVGSLSLKSTLPGEGLRAYAGIDYVGVDKKHQRNGLAMAMYRAALQYMSPKWKGIKSYLPDRVNKKAVPTIWRRLHGYLWPDNVDYMVIDRPTEMKTAAGSTDSYRVPRAHRVDEPERCYECGSPKELQPCSYTWSNDPLCPPCRKRYDYQWCEPCDMNHTRGICPDNYVHNPNDHHITAGDITGTPQFKAWFKGSKVVDESGKPMRMYHGTTQEFSDFESKGGLYGWFTSDTEYASGYPSRDVHGTKRNSNVIPVYLSLQNPAPLSMWKERSGRSSSERVEELKAQGYDGIIENYYGEVTAAAFFPNQIKSAIGNNGAYDPKSNRITAAAKEWAPWVGVDLDGTLAKELAEFNPKAIGEPIPAMVEKIKKTIADGKTVKIFTARMADREHAPRIAKLIAAYTNKHIGIPLEATCEKDPGMEALWDDKARGVEKNEGEFKTAASDVNSPAFQSWFKGSKVVDAEGNPLRVYHGTGADIEEFKYEFTNRGRDQFGSGFYFTDDPTAASGYAHERTISDEPKPGGEQANVLPVYLAIRKPIHVQDGEAVEPPLTSAQIRKIVLAAPDLDNSLTNFGDVEYEGKAAVLNLVVSTCSDGDLLYQLTTLANDFYPKDVEKFNRVVNKVTGYDGYMANGIYVAWFPNQIKSAIGNSGKFDPKDHRITSSADVTSSPAFRAWFNGSKVVDEQGHPMRMFHGTSADFDTFDSGQTGKNFSDPTGFFFTNNTSHDVVSYGKGESEVYEDMTSAGAYARNSMRNHGGGANIMPVYLSVKNPLVIEKDADGAGILSLGESRNKGLGRLVNEAREQGHDGVILRDTSMRLRSGEYETVVAVMSPNQVKSAIGNSGNYDQKDHRITASYNTYDEYLKANEEARKYLGLSEVDPNAQAYHATNSEDIDSILRDGFKPGGRLGFNANEIQGMMTGPYNMVVPRYGDTALRVVPKPGARILKGEELFNWYKTFGDLSGRGKEATEALRKEGWDAVEFAPGKQVWVNPDMATLVHDENKTAANRGRIRLYRGLQQPFDGNFDLSKTDAPTGYSTWTGNPELARQYAGENGHVYYIDLPKSELGTDLVDADGERPLFVCNGKPAGLNGVSGNEYLVYNGHNKYSPSLVKQASALTAAAKPFPNSKIQGIVYHGTREPFTRVNMSMGAQGVFWVTNDKAKIENGESGASSSKCILEMYVNIENPAGWPEYEKKSLGELKRDYDGVILTDADGTFDAIVFKPSQVRIIGQSKTASPDFGYSHYNDREADLKKLHIKEPDLGVNLLEAEAVDLTKKDNNTQGYVTAEKMFLNNGEFSYAVTHSKINPEWRGTGLGQLLYDRIIAQAKKRGAAYLYSDIFPNNLSEDAKRAWKRLGERYPVEYYEGLRRYRIPLNAKGVVKTAVVFEPKTAASKTADQSDYKFGYEHGLVGFPGNVPYFQERMNEGRELRDNQQDYMRGHKDGTEEAARREARRAETGEHKCPECSGSGKGLWGAYCSECGGTGSISAEQANTVDTLHHLTDDPNFKPDPNFVPEDNALAIYPRTRPGLFAARPEDVSNWVDGHGYDRPYVAEIQVPRHAHEPGRWGHERFIPAENFDKAKVVRVTPRQQRKSSSQKTASPDFGYTKFHNREKDLKKVKFVSQGREGDYFGVAAKFGGTDIGVIECSITARLATVYNIWIDGTWRGTGLGQLLYDHAIQVAKSIGMDYFSSDDQLTDDAVSAWERLRKRYPMEEVDNLDYDPEAEFDGSVPQHPVRYRIDLGDVPTRNLGTVKTAASKIAVEAMAVTETPEFKQWFGNSLAVGSNCKPVIFYHGTTADFDQFALEHGGSGTLAADSQGAIFFTSKPEVAEDFAGYQYVTRDGKNVERSYTPGANIRPVFLKLENPEVWEMSGGSYEESWLTDAIKDAKKEGRDSVIFMNMRDGSISTVGPWKQSHVVAVFSPEQVRPVYSFDKTAVPVVEPTGTTTASSTNELYHGTAVRNIDLIREHGLRPGSDDTVHVSASLRTAQQFARTAMRSYDSDEYAVVVLDRSKCGELYENFGSNNFCTDFNVGIPKEAIIRVDVYEADDDTLVKTASAEEPGLLFRSPETPDRNNDYDPNWDYEVRAESIPELAKIAKEASQRLYTELKSKGIIDYYMFGFEVWDVDLSDRNAVGMYIHGTYDFPVVLIDLNAHIGYEDQIGKTIRHELRHALQESKDEESSEEDAESDDEFEHVNKTAAATKLPSLSQIGPFYDAHSSSDHVSHQEKVWEELWSNGNAERVYNTVVSYLNNLPRPLTIYRAIAAPELAHIRNGVGRKQREEFESLPHNSSFGFGACWSTEESGAIAYDGGNPDYTTGQTKDKTFIIRGTVSDTDVNWEETIFLMMVSESEMEIRLEDNARVRVTGVREGKGEWQKPPNSLRVVRAASTWANRWRQTQVIPKGTILYHGTSEDFDPADIITPAWFSTSRSVADNFSHWNGDPKAIHEYKVIKPIRLPRIDDKNDFEAFTEKFGIDTTSAEDMRGTIQRTELPGWIIPQNYSDGDDILLVSTNNIVPVDQEPEPPKGKSITEPTLLPGLTRGVAIKVIDIKDGDTISYEGANGIIEGEVTIQPGQVMVKGDRGGYYQLSHEDLLKGTTLVGRGNVVHRVVASKTAADPKWTKGGCYAYAKALKKQFPEGEYIGVYLVPPSFGYFIHAGLKVGDKILDAEGSSTMQGWLKRWSKFPYSEYTVLKPMTEDDIEYGVRSQHVDGKFDGVDEEVARTHIASAGTLSAQDLINYVTNISKGSGFNGKQTYRSQINRYPVWKLGTFDLSKINPDDLANIRNMERCEFRFNKDIPSPAERIREYAEEKTPFPPIVVNRRGQIVDGFHRAAAALYRGDKTIPAYTPVTEKAAGLNVPKTAYISPELMKKLEAGVDEEDAILVPEFPVAEITMHERSFERSLRDLESGRPSKTEGPIVLFYNAQYDQFLVDDGCHRLVDAVRKGKKYVSAKVYSGYSTTGLDLRPVYRGEPKAKLAGLGFVEARDLQFGDLMYGYGRAMVVRNKYTDGDEIVVSNNKGEIRRLDPNDKVKVDRKAFNQFAPTASSTLTVYHASDKENLTIDPNHKPQSGGIGEFYVTTHPEGWQDTLGREHVHEFTIPTSAVATKCPSNKQLVEWAVEQGYMKYEEVRRPSGELVYELDDKTPMVRPTLTEKAKSLPFYGIQDPLRGGGLTFLLYAYLKAHGFSALESEYSPDGQEIAVFDTTCLTPKGKKTAAKEFSIDDVKIKQGKGDYSYTWFAYWKGERIGAASLGVFGEKELAPGERCIWNSFVKEGFRRKGVATKLYDAIEEYCKSQGWKLVASPQRVLSDEAFGLWKKRNPETVKSDSRMWNAPYIGKQVEYKGVPVIMTSMSQKGGVGEYVTPQKSVGVGGTEVTSSTTWVPAEVVFQQLGRPEEMTKTATTSPETILRWAKQWEGACIDVDVTGPAESLDWKEEPAFDLHKVEGWDEGKYDELYRHAQEIAEEVGEEDTYFGAMCEAIKNHTIEPIFVAEGMDGQFYVWEGNHRVGIAHVLGVDTMPAFVGYRKGGKTATVRKVFHGTPVQFENYNSQTGTYYFTNNEEYAKWFAKSRYLNDKDKQGVVQVYNLDLNNPFDARKVKNLTYQEYANLIGADADALLHEAGSLTLKKRPFWFWFRNTELVSKAALEAKGYDGIIQNERTALYGSEVRGTSYVAFYPSQFTKIASDESKTKKADSEGQVEWVTWEEAERYASQYNGYDNPAVLGVQNERVSGNSLQWNQTGDLEDPVFRKEAQQLARAIRKSGRFKAVAIDQDNFIIDGHHRVMAADILGWDDVPCTRITLQEREDEPGDEEFSDEEDGFDIISSGDELIPWDGEGYNGPFPGYESGGKLSAITMVPVDKIQPTEDHLDPQTLENLVHALKYDDGKEIPAIIVGENGDGTYFLIDGHHRFEAAKRVGYKEVPVRIYTDPYDRQIDKTAAVDETYYHSTAAGDAIRSEGFKPSVRGELGSGVYVSLEPMHPNFKKHEDHEILSLKIPGVRLLHINGEAPNTPLEICYKLYGREKGQEVYEQHKKEIFKYPYPESSWPFLHRIIKEAGYDGIQADNSITPRNIVIFDPAKIQVMDAPAIPSPKYASVSSVALPSFEEVVAKAGGLKKLIRDTHQSWTQMAEFSKSQAMDWNSLTPEEKKELILDDAEMMYSSHYADMVHIVEGFKWPLTIYRAVGIDSIEKLNQANSTIQLGLYWSYDEDAAKPYGNPYASNVIKLMGRVNPEAIDWQRVFVAAMHPDLRNEECEIALKKGAEVELLAYKSQIGGWQPIPESMQSLRKVAAETPLLKELNRLRPEMAKAAQAVYDDWQPGEDGDEVYGSGGICDAIAEAIGGVISSHANIEDLTFADGGADGDDHQWVIAYSVASNEAYEVDIPFNLYERGSGYSWTKIPGVVFEPDDVYSVRLRLRTWPKGTIGEG